METDELTVASVLLGKNIGWVLQQMFGWGAVEIRVTRRRSVVVVVVIYKSCDWEHESNAQVDWLGEW